MIHAQVAAKGKVLLVEDQPTYRRIYHDLLLGNGFSVVEAEDGEKGWELALSERPNLILMDVVMPRLDGFGLLKRLQSDARTRDIPVIMLSAKGEHGDMSQALELGASDYSIKGFHSPKVVIGKLNTILDRSKSETSRYWIAIADTRGDAAKLRKDYRMVCPACACPMLLELSPCGETNSGEFVARLRCDRCNRAAVRSIV
jgi:DNA-binding response OmpR family regulator